MEVSLTRKSRGARRQEDAMPRPDTYVREGMIAPELSLPTLDGEWFDLRDLRGTPVLVSFLRHAG